MMKKIKNLLLILLIAAAVASALAGCSFFDKKDDGTVAVTSIRVADSSIYMAPSGPTSIRQIVAEVLPENATNKKVKYDIITPGAANYITVDSSGTIKALGPVTEVPIAIRVKSVSNPEVYTDVFVSVVIAPLKRIIFDTLELEVVLGTTPKVDFKIEPDYATVERFYYEVINTNNELDVFATVDDETGVITPLSIGTARIRVYTTNTLGETQVENFLPISIVYAPLDYRLSVRTSDEKIYKQVAEPGGFDTFELDIWKEDGYPCDPNPEIHWLLNGTKIGDSSIQGSKNIVIDSESLFGGATGPQQISARLESGKNDVQILEMRTIMVYSPLTTFNIVQQPPIKEQYERGDTIVINSSHNAAQYPPDSYIWCLKEEGSDDEIVIPGATSSTLYYEVDRVGSFSILCYPVVRGVRKDSLVREVVLGEMQHSFTGTIISGVYVDGAPYGGGYVPHVKWDPIPHYTGNYIVEIRTGSEENERQLILESSKPADRPYFTANGVYIPDHIADLTQSFSVKIKTEGYNFTEWTNYAGGSIAASRYEYLDPLAGVEDDLILSSYNGYIVNMKELGELLNYVSVFRPEALDAGAGSDPDYTHGYSFEVYVPFTYAQVESDYPVNIGSTGETNPEKINAFKLISAAFNAYADSGSFRIEYNVPSPGEISITLWFKDMVEEYLSTAPSENVELPFVAHYGAVPRAGNTLPIDLNTRAVTVYTSNQLYLAATLGYKPVPAAGSGAEVVYNAARQVLKRIISDGMSDSQKVHAIYDYLTTEVLYDHELTTITGPNIDSYEGFYLEGVFLRGQAVCDGIAKAFNLLARMEGIASKKISGYAILGGNQIGHAWNKVNIGGVWYIVDATWGSSLSGSIGGEIQTHSYLLVTDGIISSTHVTYGTYPATGTERHPVFLTTEPVPGVTLTIASDDDIISLADDYISILEAGGDEIYIEVYATPDYRAMHSYDPAQAAQAILQKIGEALGRYSDFWSIGNGYFVIKVPAGD